MAPRTERGKRLAYHDGYEYRFAEHSADGERSFWRCTRRGCSARAVGPNESTTVAPRAGGKPHSHPPEPSKQEVRSRIAIAKGSGGNDSGRSTRSIVQEVNRGLEEEQLNLMPARSTMMRNINNSCSIKGFSEANSRDAIKIVLPEELVSFQDGSSFLLFDSRASQPNRDIFFVFGSQRSLQRMREYRDCRAWDQPCYIYDGL
ncbi:hypothetical protein QR680_017365 [Steinernema hermaphroditum]|uniref:FLYWCH-type domain-containing protein n=1 Tax=Steinernema hermaphroditum TaxID=289476 RepID=A0AA39LNV7_9BILA|nr:hypothetical protein QR680_017365 [Steinernema hermaphroditum]